MQKTMKLNLDDLVPQEAHFRLSSTGETVHTLKPYTLRVQMLAIKKFGEEKLGAAIQNSDVAVLVELAWDVLKDQKPFANFEDFLEKIVTYKDRQAVVDAMLTTAGLSQPVLEKLAAQLEEQQKGNAQSPVVSTGANFTTA